MQSPFQVTANNVLNRNFDNQEEQRQYNNQQNELIEQMNNAKNMSKQEYGAYLRQQIELKQQNKRKTRTQSMQYPPMSLNLQQQNKPQNSQQNIFQNQNQQQRKQMNDFGNNLPQLQIEKIGPFSKIPDLQVLDIPSYMPLKFQPLQFNQMSYKQPMIEYQSQRNYSEGNINLNMNLSPIRHNQSYQKQMDSPDLYDKEYNKNFQSNFQLSHHTQSQQQYSNNYNSPQSKQNSHNNSVQSNNSPVQNGNIRGAFKRINQDPDHLMEQQRKKEQWCRELEQQIEEKNRRKQIQQQKKIQEDLQFEEEQRRYYGSADQRDSIPKPSIKIQQIQTYERQEKRSEQPIMPNSYNNQYQYESPIPKRKTLSPQPVSTSPVQDKDSHQKLKYNLQHFSNVQQNITPSQQLNFEPLLNPSIYREKPNIQMDLFNIPIKQISPNRYNFSSQMKLLKTELENSTKQRDNALQEMLNLRDIAKSNDISNLTSPNRNIFRKKPNNSYQFDKVYDDLGLFKHPTETSKDLQELDALLAGSSKSIQEDSHSQYSKSLPMNKYQKHDQIYEEIQEDQESNQSQSDVDTNNNSDVEQNDINNQSINSFHNNDSQVNSTMGDIDGIMKRLENKKYSFKDKNLKNKINSSKKEDNEEEEQQQKEIIKELKSNVFYTNNEKQSPQNNSQQNNLENNLETSFNNIDNMIQDFQLKYDYDSN